ncbi:MAG: hypothetical protein PUB99_09685 [Oscillospiraceae bacterium]|nr:hypothetical protein [Oscillospiraceae bacterium]
MAEDLVLGVDFDLSQVEKSIDKMQKQFDAAIKETEKLPKIIADLDEKIEAINSKEEQGIRLTQQEKTLRESLVNQSATYADRLQEMNERAARLGAELDNARLDPSGFAEANGYIQQAGKEAERIPAKVESIGKSAKAAGDQAKKHLKGGFTSAKTAVSNFVLAGKKIALMSFGVLTVSALLKKMVTSLKNVVTSNRSVSTSLNRIKSNLVVAFQPIVDKIIPWIQQLLSLLERASSAFAVFMNKLLGADINQSVKGAKSTYDALFNGDSNGTKSQVKQIESQIDALQKKIAALNKANKALKREYDAQNAVLDKQKNALNGQIKEIDKYIKQLKRQESAERALAQAQRDALDAQIQLLERKKAARQDELSAQRKAIRAQESAIDKEIKALQKQKDAITDAKKDDQKSLADFDTLNVLPGTSEQEDPEIQAIDAQIDALEEKKDALQEASDAIPEDADDPFIRQIEAQIEALQAQKDAIAEVDYSPMIEQQELAKESLQEQIDVLDQQADKLQEDYEHKLTVNEDGKIALQEQIDKLQEMISTIEEANEKKFDPIDPEDTTQDFDAIAKKIHLVTELVVGLMSIIAIVVGFFTGNIPLIIAGFLGLGAVIYDVVKTFGADIKKWWEETALPWIQSLPDKVKEWFKEKLNQFMESDFYQWFIQPIIDDINWLVEEAKRIWNEHIAPIFTKAWWLEKFEVIKEAGKSAFNGLLGIVERAINWIVEKLNLIHFDVPDWVPGIGGKTFGFHLSPIDIPALAQGAVIPGGKPWLAMLGDQPAGQTNIEAPLSTIQEALQAVLDRNGNNPTNVNITFKGSLSQLARVLLPEIEIAKKRNSVF